ncbi:AAEL007277-PA, partial [Aedes aegypti]
ISEICLAKFDQLPKTGKPKAGFEWTILSAIVKAESSAGVQKLDVVSLGTGTKCLGANELSEKGDVLNDSHAEIMARRGFLRYLMNEMKLGLSDHSHIFDYEIKTKKFRLKNEVFFHFFTTHSPCGDASIYEQADKSSQDEPPTKKIKLDDKTSEIGSIIIDRAEGMTGGKLLQCSGSDLMAQDVGMIRTKPGKGQRTLSVSCSDKMARWNVLGVQGSLLMSLLVQPIYLESITFCDGTEYSKEATERALWRRWESALDNDLVIEPFRMHKPKVCVASNKQLFRFRKQSKPDDPLKFQPAPGGIVWCAGIEDRPLEVEIGGRRQGITKKKLGTAAARLKISKIELFSTFVSLRNAMGLDVDEVPSSADEKMNLLPPDDCSRKSAERGPSTASDENQHSSLRYVDAKKICRAYREQWNTLRVKVFRVWSEKPSNLLEFVVKP